MSEQDDIPMTYGAGWVGEMPGAAGYAATAPSGATVAVPVMAARSMALADASTARELAEREARQDDVAERNALVARELVHYDPSYADGDLTLGGALARAEKRMVIDDVHAETARRHALEAATTYKPSAEERVADLSRAAHSRSFWAQVSAEVEKARDRRAAQRRALANNVDDAELMGPGAGFVETGRQPW